MHYRNPPVRPRSAPADEDRELLRLLVIVGGILVLLLGGSALLATHLAPQIPFAVEQRLARTIGRQLGAETDPQHAPQQEALQRLVDRIAARMDLPEGMQIEVHYLDQSSVNAAATLGGRLLIYRGLLDRLSSEQALAAVLAHEIGHVRHRHVISALGRGVAVLLALQAVGVKSQSLTNWLLGESAQLTVLGFSREAEREADLAALHAVQQIYGDVGGILELFDLFASLQGDAPVDLWQTHPGPEQRRAELAEQAMSLGYALSGQSLPLPAALSASDRTP